MCVDGSKKPGIGKRQGLTCVRSTDNRLWRYSTPFGNFLRVPSVAMRRVRTRQDAQVDEWIYGAAGGLDTLRQRRPLWGCSSVARAPALQAGGRGLKPHHFHQFWGRSSVGRAPRWQRGGRRIVPARLHQNFRAERTVGYLHIMNANGGKPPRPQVSLNPCIPRQSLPDSM